MVDFFSMSVDYPNGAIILQIALIIALQTSKSIYIYFKTPLEWRCQPRKEETEVNN
jgi:hypothetical protein